MRAWPQCPASVLRCGTAGTSHPAGCYCRAHPARDRRYTGSGTKHGSRDRSGSDTGHRAPGKLAYARRALRIASLRREFCVGAHAAPVPLPEYLVAHCVPAVASGALEWVVIAPSLPTGRETIFPRAQRLPPIDRRDRTSKHEHARPAGSACPPSGGTNGLRRAVAYWLAISSTAHDRHRCLHAIRG